jgi:hypothetical protein
MPNRLEASFKSIKHELMPGDASSALEIKEFEGALKASLNHTRKHFSQPNPSSKESSLGSWREERSGVNA